MLLELHEQMEEGTSGDEWALSFFKMDCNWKQPSAKVRVTSNRILAVCTSLSSPSELLPNHIHSVAQRRRASAASLEQLRRTSVVKIVS